MTRQNVELVQRTLAAFQGGRPEEALGFLHPEIEFDVRTRPDGKVWHGREGVRRALQEWTGAWEGWEMEIERYIDADGGRVAALWREHGRAGASGMALSQQGVSVFTVRDGLIVAMLVSVERDSTLQALGLRSGGPERSK